MKSKSVIASRQAMGLRTVKKVPFVELRAGRIQGVISSGSDLDRVYVAFLEGTTGNFYCSTNNNRVCGGMGRDGCKHLHQLIDEAILQFSGPIVATYLGLAADAKSETAYELTSQMSLNMCKESPGVVFSRFLSYLRYCELETAKGSMVEMDWFTS